MKPRRAARDLAPVGPVGILDRAVGLAREGGLDICGPAWLGGGVLAAVCVGIYYLERVEGITSLRPFFALALVLAWWVRSLLVGKAARRVVDGLWDTEPEPEAGRAVDVLRTSLVVGLGLWCWSWLLVAGSLGGPLVILLVVPFFALRGAVAPSWLARSASTTHAGWRGFFSAVRDSNGMRVAGVVTEALLLLGMVGVIFNVFGVTVFIAILLRSFGGFDIAALESFVSTENTFVMLVIASVVLVLFEPVRATHSACVYVGARVRAEGLDLRVSLDEAIRHSLDKRGSAKAAAAARAAAMLLAVLAVGGEAHAQQPGWDPPPPPSYDDPYEQPYEEPSYDDYGTYGSDPYDYRGLPEPVAPAEPPAPPALRVDELSGDDRAVQEDVDAILARSEFREFEDNRGRGLRDLIDRFFEWLLRPREEMQRVEGPRLPTIPLPGGSLFLLIGVALLLGVLLYLFMTRREARAQAEVQSALAEVSTDIRDRPPRSFLEDAATLRAQGKLREALRSLYLATLVALDRRRWIAFDPHLTNWQYLRQMPRGAIRDAFKQFTRLFDYKWYGEEATTEDDYARCHALAEEIVAGEERAA